MTDETTTRRVEGFAPRRQIDLSMLQRKNRETLAALAAVEPSDAAAIETRAAGGGQIPGGSAKNPRQTRAKIGPVRISV